MRLVADFTGGGGERPFGNSDWKEKGNERQF